MIGTAPIAPHLVKKGQTRLEGNALENPRHVCAWHDHPLASWAQLQELYGVEVSPTLISHVRRAGDG